MSEPAHPPSAPAATRKTGRLKAIGVGAAAVAVLVAGAGLWSRSMADQKLRAWTAEQATPTIQLATLKPPGADGALVIPGQVEAFSSAAVHSRVSGYLRRWNVDIGARVKAGQLLAEIDTPEADQQLAQARADLASAKAAQGLAQTTATRWTRLLEQSAVSQQEYDEKAGDLAAKTSLVQSAEANVARLAATKAFGRILAPFDGVITSRNAQLGQLVSTSSVEPLFSIVDDSRLRIYVRVPQVYSGQIAPGAKATLTAPEFPGKAFDATLVNTAQAIDGDSGTLLAELQLDNAERALRPGSYVQAKFEVAAAAGAIQVPSSALMFREGGMMLGVVGADNRVHIQKVVIGRDMGATVEVASGLAATDRVIDNPSDTLSEGDEVRIFQPEAKAEAKS